MQKLSEVKSKTDDSGTKARQYLDGLLSIPFNIFREEPILLLSKTVECAIDDFMTSTPDEIIEEIILLSCGGFFVDEYHELVTLLPEVNRDSSTHFDTASHQDSLVPASIK